MNIDKKYIIIFGTLILLLVIITGGITYYKERTDLVKQDEYFSAPIPEDKEYEIWCYDYDDQWKDCAEGATFWPKQLVSISVNLEKFDNIPYDPYYLCWYSDLSKMGMRCHSRPASTLGGLVLSEEVVPEGKQVFTLIKISVYPDSNFEEAEEIVIIDLEGTLIK
jgi:hypothetical protein